MVNYKYKGVDCPPGFHPYKRTKGPRPMKHKICAKNPKGTARASRGKGRAYYYEGIKKNAGGAALVGSTKLKVAQMKALYKRTKPHKPGAVVGGDRVF